MPQLPKPRILGLAINLSDEYILIHVVLSRPVSLKLIYSYTPPTAVPRWRTFRGTLRVCGATYIWHNTICIPPTPQPPDDEWRFLVPRPAPGAEISFFFADDCAVTVATWTTVPFIVLVPPCPPVPGYPIVAYAIPPPPLQGPPATIQTSILVS